MSLIIDLHINYITKKLYANRFENQNGQIRLFIFIKTKILKTDTTVKNFNSPICIIEK